MLSVPFLPGSLHRISSRLCDRVLYKFESTNINCLIYFPQMESTLRLHLMMAIFMFMQFMMKGQLTEELVAVRWVLFSILASSISIQPQLCWNIVICIIILKQTLRHCWSHLNKIFAYCTCLLTGPQWTNHVSGLVSWRLLPSKLVHWLWAHCL